MSTLIAAEHRQVWRALTDPSELVTWDDRILAAVESAEEYPFAGQHMRWRYKIGSVQLVMHDRPLEIRPLEKLQSSISVGSLRFEQTYVLQPEAGSKPKTRLTMKIQASNSVPVIGEIVDRFEVRRMASEHIDVTLAALQQWCESKDKRAS